MPCAPVRRNRASTYVWTAATPVAALARSHNAGKTPVDQPAAAAQRSAGHRDSIIRYLSWDNARWTAKVVNGRFVHAPNDDWNRPHDDVILNYYDWNGARGTVNIRDCARGAGGAAGGICDDPAVLAIIDDWLRTAIPPQKAGESLRYERWGRMVGRSLTATINAPNPPDTHLSRCNYLWQRADSLRSTNIGTLREYVENRRR
jgi:hypothetical protein